MNFEKVLHNLIESEEGESRMNLSSLLRYRVKVSPQVRAGWGGGVGWSHGVGVAGVQIEQKTWRLEIRGEIHH